MADSFGDLLRRFRVAASLTQQALADRCRVSPATIAALEQGRRTAPRLSTVRLIADALDLSPADLESLARAASGSGAPAPAAAAEPAPPAPAVTRKSRSGTRPPVRALPVPITPLFGRYAETRAVTDVLTVERLVTLVGPGGVGKTRLALQVASDTLNAFTGGTWWIELGPVRDPDSVPDAVLRSLGATEQPVVPIREQLLAAMPDDPVLLVIDNCEHVLDAAATLISDLLTHRWVTVLATSREPLGVPGEIRWPVPPLAIPAPDAVTADDMIDIDSVALFVERATRASPYFALSDAHCGAIARVCRRLDGLPLAVELVAARIGALTPQQLAAELEERIPLGAGAARGVPGRHSTLWESIDWSYRLLGPPEQAAFRCLGCFDGSFGIEAFAAVSGRLGAADPRAVTSILPRLIEKSLVLADTQMGRYRMLETIRAYAIEQATEAGELAAIYDAHADYYASWLAGLHAAHATDDVLDLIDTDYLNLRAAVMWSIETRSPRAATIVAGMGVHWYQRARYHDARTLGDGALDVIAGHDGTGDGAIVWAKAVGAVGLARVLSGDAEFRAALEVAAAIAKSAGDHLTEGWCRFSLGMRPSHDSIHMEAAYELAAAVPAPILAGLTACSICNAGMDPFKEEWLRKGARFAFALDNAAARAFCQIAEAESLAEQGRMSEAVEVAVPAAFDTRASPTTRMFGITRTMQMALYRRDFELARVVSAMSDELAKVWPLGGSWQTSTWTALGSLTRLWLALLRGEPQPAFTADNLERAIASAMMPSVVRTVCRAAVDRGDRLEPASMPLGPVPPTADSLMGASIAAVRAVHATLDGDDRRATRHWSAVLAVAVPHRYLLLVCDALEGLGCLAGRRGDTARATRLLAAAGRCRTEITYRWRFGFEQRQIDEAWATASPAAAGPVLSWQVAAESALAP